jgi:ribosomal protein S18 acetylase RimI-like enzyme
MVYTSSSGERRCHDAPRLSVRRHRDNVGELGDQRWHPLGMFSVRPAHHEDAPLLREIERRAGERFRDVGLGLVADDEPPSVEELEAYAEAGRSWVAVGTSAHPVGYIIVDVVDGNVHIEQMSVHPDHQGVGVGRALIDRVCAWAVETGRPAVTLTTYADIPWNRPLYEHLGFRVLKQDETGDGLRSIRRTERARGLDLRPRVCMRLDLE